MMCFINMNVWIKVISITAVNSLSWLPCLVLLFQERDEKLVVQLALLWWRSKLGQWPLAWRRGGVFSVVDGILNGSATLSVILGPATSHQWAACLKCKIWHTHIHTPPNCWIKISRREAMKCPVILMLVKLWETPVYGAERHYWTHRLHVHIHSDTDIHKTHGKLRRQRNMQRWKDSSDNIPSAEHMEGLSWEQKPACAEMTALQFLGYIILHKFLNFCKLWCLTNWIISICYLIEWL